MNRASKFANNQLGKIMKNYFRVAMGCTLGIVFLSFTSCKKAEYGDAPDGSSTGYAGIFEQTGQFPTLEARNGARALQSKDAVLGSVASLEKNANDTSDPDGQPNLNPSNTDSDDGIVSMVIIPVSIPVPAELQILVSGPAGGSGGDFFVNVLIDLNLNGKWGGTAVNNEPEWVVQNFPVSVTPGDSLVVKPPRFFFSAGNRLPDKAWMRIALTRESIISSDWDGSGEFSSGEIEDHVIDLPKFGDNKCVPIPIMTLVGGGNVVTFPMGVNQVNFSFSVTDVRNCPNAQFGWSFTHTGGCNVGIVQLPQLSAPLAAPAAGIDIGGMHPINAGGPVILKFSATRCNNLPATYTYRSWGIDPKSQVTPTGVIIGYEDNSGTIRFVGEEEREKK